MSEAVAHEPSGYERLATTDPHDDNWLDAAKAAAADGSAYRMAATTEEVRRHFAELRSER